MLVFSIATAFLLKNIFLDDSAKSDVLILSGFTMGTQYNIQLSDISPEVDLQALAQAVQTRLEHIDRGLMSTYAADSELSRFNHSLPAQPFAVDPELATIVLEALDVYRLSNHAFDITVGPLVSLWGFGAEGNAISPPEQAAIDSAMSLLGSEQLKVSLNPSSLFKAKDMQLDLSGIAKGYGVDQIALLLQQQGIDNFLVEIGGELVMQGRKSANELWRIAIESPQDSSFGDAYQGLSSLGEPLAVASSGDYRNYFEFEGLHYSHEINPLTGYPVTHNLVSVTVVDTSAMRADALATAFMVMGFEQSFTLASREGMAVYFIMASEDGYNSRYTNTFRKYIGITDIIH